MGDGKSTSGPRAKRRASGKPFTGKDDPRRNKDHEWKPGQSGNPSGLPPGFAHVRDLARTFTTAAMECLARDMVAAREGGARVAAAKAVIDRGWGTPEQTVALTGADRGPVRLALEGLSDVQLDALEQAAAAIGALGGGADEDAEPGGDPGGEGEA